MKIRKNKRKKWIFGMLAIVGGVIAISIILQAVRKPVKQVIPRKKHFTKEEQKVQKEKIDYKGLGNEQGNIENGGDQVYLDHRGILIKLFDDTNQEMLCFNDSQQKLELYCDKSSCLHNGQDCVSNQLLRYLNSYSGVVFGVSDSAVNEIWKCRNNKITCFYRAKNDIYGLWAYQGYLYYMTDFGVYRLSVKDPSKPEKVLNRPVLYEYITFYKNKMYFCSEDRLLYQANLDGSKKKRFCDEKMVSPQVCGDFLYYRSAEFDKKGKFQMKNTLKCISLKNKKKKVILDEVYQFNVDTKEKEIYYTQIVQNDEAVLNVIDLKHLKKRRITDCASAYLYTFPESDWIIFEKYEGETEEEEVGGRPTCLYCIKKDGSGEKRLDYPERVVQ